MMTTQPEALRLADSAHLGYRVGWQREAATELRRLHAVNQELLEALENLVNRCNSDFVYAADETVIAAEAAIERLHRAAVAKAEGKA